MGVKFRADVAGSITALRFYKGATNTGTHVGNLWTSTGTLLASVTFTNETASGWQQATLPSPVPITANTTYVASYHTTVGRYAVSSSYFATTGVDNPPLHALSTTAGGGNGVYRRGPAGSFPNATYQGENYWVDVVLSTVPDTTPPTVTSRTPANGATGIATTTAVTATFSEAMNASTLTTSTVTLQTGSTTVPATVSYTPTTFTATLTPTSPLAGTTLYTVTVTGGAGGVKDFAGNALVSSATWSFTTGAADTTAPTVTSQSPAAGVIGVAVGTTVTATFSEAMNASTLTTSTVTLQTGSTTLPATVSYNPTHLHRHPHPGEPPGGQYPVHRHGRGRGQRRRRSLGEPPGRQCLLVLHHPDLPGRGPRRPHPGGDLHRQPLHDLPRRDPPGGRPERLRHGGHHHGHGRRPWPPTMW